MNTKIKKWLKENSMIVVLLGLFFTVPLALRFIDDTSAAFDPGILHSIVLVCVIYAIFQACTWSIVKTIWPDIGDYFKRFFSLDFKGEITSRDKIIISLSVYFVILISLIILTCAVL